MLQQQHRSVVDKTHKDPTARWKPKIRPNKTFGFSRRDRSDSASSSFSTSHSVGSRASCHSGKGFPRFRTARPTPSNTHPSATTTRPGSTTKEGDKTLPTTASSCQEEEDASSLSSRAMSTAAIDGESLAKRSNRRREPQGVPQQLGGNHGIDPFDLPTMITTTTANRFPHGDPTEQSTGLAPSKPIAAASNNNPEVPATTENKGSIEQSSASSVHSKRQMDESKADAASGIAPPKQAIASESIKLPPSTKKELTIQNPSNFKDASSTESTRKTHKTISTFPCKMDETAIRREGTPFVFSRASALTKNQVNPCLDHLNGIAFRFKKVDSCTIETLDSVTQSHEKEDNRVHIQARDPSKNHAGRLLSKANQSTQTHKEQDNRIHCYKDDDGPDPSKNGAAGRILRPSPSASILSEANLSAISRRESSLREKTCLEFNGPRGKDQAGDNENGVPLTLLRRNTTETSTHVMGLSPFVEFRRRAAMTVDETDDDDEHSKSKDTSALPWSPVKNQESQQRQQKKQASSAPTTPTMREYSESSTSDGEDEEEDNDNQDRDDESLHVDKVLIEGFNAVATRNLDTATTEGSEEDPARVYYSKRYPRHPLTRTPEPRELLDDLDAVATSNPYKKSKKKKKLRYFLKSRGPPHRPRTPEPKHLLEKFNAVATSTPYKKSTKKSKRCVRKRQRPKHRPRTHKPKELLHEFNAVATNAVAKRSRDNAGSGEASLERRHPRDHATQTENHAGSKTIDRRLVGHPMRRTTAVLDALIDTALESQKKTRKSNRKTVKKGHASQAKYRIHNSVSLHGRGNSGAQKDRACDTRKHKDHNSAALPVKKRRLVLESDDMGVTSDVSQPQKRARINPRRVTLDALPRASDAENRFNHRDDSSGAWIDEDAPLPSATRHQQRGLTQEGDSDDDDSDWDKGWDNYSIESVLPEEFPSKGNRDESFLRSNFHATDSEDETVLFVPESTVPRNANDSERVLAVRRNPRRLTLKSYSDPNRTGGVKKISILTHQSIRRIFFLFCACLVLFVGYDSCNDFRLQNRNRGTEYRASKKHKSVPSHIVFSENPSLSLVEASQMHETSVI